VSRKLTRLLLAASVAAGFAIAPMLSAQAATSYVFLENDQLNGGKIEAGNHVTDVLPGDTVIWHVKNGEHTVTPKNDQPGYHVWPKVDPPERMKSGDEFEVTFPNAGRYFYFCEIHPTTMKGYVDVKDQVTTTTTTPPTPTTAAPTTTTTRVVVPGPTTTTTSAPVSPAGVKPPTTTAPAPTTTTAKDKRGKDDKKDEETTTTTLPPPPPVDLPDSAIIPVLPTDGAGTTTQNGIEAPDGTPEGDAIALLKSKKGGGKAMKLLIVSGLGLGALGLGTAGYKYANRSSKYFPA